MGNFEKRRALFLLSTWSSEKLGQRVEFGLIFLVVMMNELGDNSDLERRGLLLEEMKFLDRNKINCSECKGKCCSAVANSMQCSPIEAMDISLWLEKNGYWSDQLIEKLKKCISDYRLDYEISTTRGEAFRRTYECPFFNYSSAGCFLAPQVKPYGCLGFNPNSEGVKDGENCSSSLALLKRREDKWEKKEKILNQKLIEELLLLWDKLPLPLALIKMRMSLNKKV